MGRRGAAVLKRLDLVVGCNGAGKSTFVALTLAPLLPRSPFVNADEIAKQRWPNDPASHSYEAARIASKTRQLLITSGRSFIAETVFSHESKLDLAADAVEAGFTVVLHVIVIPESLAVQRVAYRVRAGGHAVPENKIRARYARLWSLVSQAAAIADTATFYDNGGIDGPRVVAQLSGGSVVGATEWPAWTPVELIGRV